MSNEAPASPSPSQVLAARERAGLTQAAAGALLYKSVRHWQHWEYGDYDLDPAFWDLWQFRAGLITAEQAKSPRK